jgi:hypothetical protein
MQPDGEKESQPLPRIAFKALLNKKNAQLENLQATGPFAIVVLLCSLERPEVLNRRENRKPRQLKRKSSKGNYMRLRVCSKIFDLDVRNSSALDRSACIESKERRARHAASK